VFFELLPKLFDSGDPNISIALMLGMLLQIALDYFSKGAEHGHIHQDKSTTRFPLALFLSLSIHALIEGFPVADSSRVLTGVVIHKIPIALILSLFLIQSQLSGFKQVLFLILFGSMTPLGTLMALYIPELNPHKPVINALAVGVFLHVATTILFESSKDHQFNQIKLLIILAGALAGYLI
jgi:zinc transporter ZupT